MKVAKTEDELIEQIREWTGGAALEADRVGGKAPDPHDVALWFCAVNDASGFLESATVKDMARLMVDGLEPITVEEFLETVLDGADGDEADAGWEDYFEYAYGEYAGVGRGGEAQA